MNHLPLRGAVLLSGSASSLRYLHANDPHFGSLYQIVGAFSDVPRASGLAFAESIGISTRVLDFKTWRKERGVSLADLKAREAYFAEVVIMLAKWNPDCLLLMGCMLLLTEPLLSAYAGRMLNVHPAFLSIMTPSGDRKYRGLNVVERTMQAGDPTGSTVHIVTPEPDMGPIVAESTPLEYRLGDDPQKHQEKMKTACDGPAYQAALATLAARGWPFTPWAGR